MDYRGRKFNALEYQSIPASAASDTNPVALTASYFMPVPTGTTSFAVNNRQTSFDK